VHLPFSPGPRQFHVSEVVQGIENTDDVETVSDGPRDELSNGVVRIKSVPHKILAAGGASEVRFLLKRFRRHPQPLPGILVEKGMHVSKVAPPHTLPRERLSNLIHQFRHGKHILRSNRVAMMD
jgi:hypothetical protein